MRFKHYHRLALALWLLAAATVCSTGQAQETAFTYQGRLNDGGNPANGSYDFQFVLYDSSTNGNPQGPVLSNAATAVSNGLFTVSLDFGNQFPGANRWLEVSVCTNASGNFITLSPRQPISATPYAITAANVLAGGIPAGVYTNAVIFSNPGNQFAGNGSGLTNLGFGSLSVAAQAQITNAASGAVAAAAAEGGLLRPSVSGLVEWNDPAAIGATNGQPLASFPDVSGNGNALYNVTANPVTYSALGINGAAAVNLPANWDLIAGNPPTTAYGLSNSIWIPAMNTNSTITLVFRDSLEKGGVSDNPPLLYGGQHLVIFSAGTNDSYWASPWDINHNAQFGGVEVNAPLSCYLPVHGHHEPYVITLRLTAGQPDSWLNGIQVVDKSLRGFSPANVQGSVFMLGNASLNGVVRSELTAVDGLFGDIIISTNAEPDTELKALHSYLMNKYAIGGGVQIALEGDSIMQGVYAGTFSNFTALAQAAFPASDVVCEAVQGQTSGQLLAFEANWVPMRVPKTTQRIAVVMYGANDLNANVPIATYAANWNASLALFHNAGYRVIGCTLPSLVRETGYATTRAEMNNSLYANATGFDGIADFAADPLMGYAGAYTNTLYFTPDQLHVTGAGYVRLFNNWLYPALAKLLNPELVLTNSNYVSFTGDGSGLTNISFNSLSAAAQAQLTNVANGAVAAVLTNVTFLYPNDTNDQTATIQAAFSKTDSVVWFTPGNYYATNLWLTSNIVVYGNGAHLNQLKTPAQNGYNNYFPDFNMGALINCNSNNVNQRIYDLILDGMSPNNYNDMTWNIWNGVNIGSVPFQGADSFSPTPCGNHNGLIINQAAGGEVRGCTAQNFDSAGFVIFSSVDQGSYQAPHLIFSGNTALTNFEGFYCQTWSEWSTYGSADYNMMDGLAANHCAVGIEDTSGNGMIFNSTFNDCFIGLNLGGGSGNGAAGGNTPTHGHVANVNLNHDYCGLVLYGQPTGEHFDGVIEMATTTNIFCGSGGNIRFNSCLLLNVFADSCTFEVANGTIYNFVVTNSYVNFVNNNTLVAFTNGVPGSDFTNVVCTSLGQSVIRHSLNRVWTNSLAGDGYEGDGSRITGLDAANLNGTLPVASLPGVTTNVSTAGITFYITNGLVMRVTTP